MMTTTHNTVAQKNVTRVRLFVLFVLFVLSSNGVFGQTQSENKETKVTTEVTVAQDQVVVSADNTVASMDFAIWFTGTAKTGNAKTTGSFSKKALINSGINTNSVLIRSLLKKVSSQESSVA